MYKPHSIVIITVIIIICLYNVFSVQIIINSSW